MPKTAAPLSATTVRSLKTPASGVTELADGGCPGLRLRVSSSGDRGWFLLMADPTGQLKRRRFRLGTYPTMGLSDARGAAHALREKVKQGFDPLAEKRATRRRATAAKTGTGTLLALIDAYGDAGGNTNRSWSEARKRISSVFAPILDRPAPDLTLSALQLTVDAHPSKTSAAAAVRFVRPALKWGAKRGLCTTGIAAELEQPHGARRTRSRVLDKAEIKAVLAALNKPEVADGYAGCIRWLFWTGCRLDEAVGATWGEIAGDLWTIPASRTKGARDNTIPLPRQAVAFLEGRAPRESSALLFPNSQGGPLDNWDRFQKRLFGLTGTHGWHRHDIRRTVATRLGDLGVAPHVIEMVLGHATPHTALAGVYNRSRYVAEHRGALQAFADSLERAE